MKILYGVNGEGLGHINRALIVTKKLRELGHEVKIASYGYAKNNCDIIIPGVSLSQNSNGSINKFKTIGNFLKFKLKKFKWEFVPELVITDFEPLSAKYARKLKIPCISIDNQHRFDIIDWKLPFKFLLFNILTKIFIKIFIGRVDKVIVSSFVANSVIVPEEYKQDINKKYILVYLRKEYLKRALPILSKYKNVVVFTNEKIKNKKVKIEKTGPKFKEYLKSAKSVVCNAGNQLISECIYYDIPFSCIPIKNQTEQEINAYYVKLYNYGTVNYRPNFDKPNKKLENGLEKIIKELEEYL